MGSFHKHQPNFTIISLFLTTNQIERCFGCIHAEYCPSKYLHKMFNIFWELEYVINYFELFIFFFKETMSWLNLSLGVKQLGGGV